VSLTIKRTPCPAGLISRYASALRSAIEFLGLNARNDVDLYGNCAVDVDSEAKIISFEDLLPSDEDLGSGSARRKDWKGIKKPLLVVGSLLLATDHAVLGPLLKHWAERYEFLGTLTDPRVSKNYHHRYTFFFFFFFGLL
jgi:hypothetical protein